MNFRTLLCSLFLLSLPVVSSADDGDHLDFGFRHDDVVATEIAWQILNATDAVTTVKGASTDPCFLEVGTWRFLGAHPAPAGVVMTGALWGLGHALVSEWLDDNAPHWAALAWEATTISATGYTVHSNFSVGVRLIGPNRYPYGYHPVGGQCVRKQPPSP